ncbi:hypothetical protein Golob_026656 [Gossypium lobatum]|uniref:DUF4283 domain-containing protein n=1 Tax=Gossypium lobatum TaxID=34289 RepID=A0A7J8LVV0_9ROSI|nr:hypothetical protein [Gossypium lobatum]
MTTNSSINEDDKGEAYQNKEANSDIVMAGELDKTPHFHGRGDIMRSFVNGIPSINFSKRINQLLINDMTYTTVIKLLGKSIGVVMSWIRFPKFSGYMYKKKILWEINRLVGKVAKLNFNTNNKARGEVTDETPNSGGEKMTNTAPEGDCLSNDNDIYGPWMIIERRNSTGAKEPKGKGKVGHIDVPIGSDLASVG